MVVAVLVVDDDDEEEKVDSAQAGDQWREGGGEMVMEQDVGLWGTKRLASCKEQHWEDVETEGVDQCNMERINYS